MLKKLILIIFIAAPILSFAQVVEETTVPKRNMTFKNFARMSAILDQCDTKSINTQREYIDLFSREEGIFLARKEKLNNENLGKEVAIILYYLDEEFPEEIPEEVCNETLLGFNTYKTEINKQIYKNFKK